MAFSSKIYDKKGYVKKRNSRLEKEPYSNEAYSFAQFLSDVGNQEIQHLFTTGALRAKLQVSQPGDKYEQEADRIAESIVSGNNSHIDSKVKASVIQKEGNKTQESSVFPFIENKIKNLEDKGSPLPQQVKDYFVPRFGMDLDHIRVHYNPEANQLARHIQARAFTKGNDIVFAKGEFKPETKEGQKLIAHELTHVAQQQQGGVKVQKKDKEDDFSIFNIFQEIEKTINETWDNFTDALSGVIDWAKQNELIENLLVFLGGASQSYAYNNLKPIDMLFQMISPLTYSKGKVSLRPSALDELSKSIAEKYDNNTAYQVGRLVGDIATIIQGIIEIKAGGGMVAGGIAGAPESAALSLSVSAAGVAVAAHGGGVIIVSGADLLERLTKIGAIAMAAMQGKGGSNSDKKQYTSANQMNEQLKQNKKLQKTVDRVDKKHVDVENAQEHVHFKDGTSRNVDGTPGHTKNGIHTLTNIEKEWLEKNGWNVDN